MKRKNKIITAALSAVLVVSLAACGEQAAGESPADKGAQALNQILEAFPDKQGFHEELQHWGFEVEAGEKFEWSKDMSANEADLAVTAGRFVGHLPLPCH